MAILSRISAGAKKVLGIFYPFKFSLPYLKGRYGIVAVVIIAGIVSSVSRLLIPVFIGEAVTKIENLSYSGVLSVGLLIIAASAVTAVFQFIVSYGSLYVSQKFEYNLRNDAFWHLLRKNYSFYEGQTSGDLLSRNTMDVHAVRNFLNNLFSQMLPTIFLIVFALYFLFSINPYFALIFLVAVPLLILTGAIFQKKQRTRWRRIRTYYGLMNERLQENIVGNRVVRGFSAEDLEIQRFSQTTGSYYDEYMEVAKLRGFYNNIMPLIVSAAATGVLIYGGYSDIISSAAVGPLVAAVNIFSLMSSPVSSFGRLIVFSENARAGIERISTLLETSMEEDVDNKNSVNLSGSITIRDVSFHKGGKKILKGINLEIRPGEFTAITGRTGSGKTTLVSMIPRFYDPDEGDILIGTKDVRKIPLAALRRHVSLVPQEINLLSGTIRENISFHREGISLADVRRAARIAEIDDFVMSLPDGYDTQVGERGITLSGGQKQRVALARTIAGLPGVIILDDATSSVDPETELRIFNNIRQEIRSATILLVTHRPSALKYADSVWKLENGEIFPVIDVSVDLQGITDGIRMNFYEVDHGKDI